MERSLKMNSSNSSLNSSVSSINGTLTKKTEVSVIIIDMQISENITEGYCFIQGWNDERSLDSSYVFSIVAIKAKNWEDVLRNLGRFHFSEFDFFVIFCTKCKENHEVEIVIDNIVELNNKNLDSFVFMNNHTEKKQNKYFERGSLNEIKEDLIFNTGDNSSNPDKLIKYLSKIIKQKEQTSSSKMETIGRQNSTAMMTSNKTGVFDSSIRSIKNMWSSTSSAFKSTEYDDLNSKFKKGLQEVKVPLEFIDLNHSVMKDIPVEYKMTEKIYLMKYYSERNSSTPSTNYFCRKINKNLNTLSLVKRREFVKQNFSKQAIEGFKVPNFCTFDQIMSAPLVMYLIPDQSHNKILPIADFFVEYPKLLDETLLTLLRNLLEISIAFLKQGLSIKGISLKQIYVTFESSCPENRGLFLLWDEKNILPIDDFLYLSLCRIAPEARPTILDADEYKIFDYGKTEAFSLAIIILLVFLKSNEKIEDYMAHTINDIIVDEDQIRKCLLLFEKKAPTTAFFLKDMLEFSPLIRKDVKEMNNILEFAIKFA